MNYSYDYEGLISEIETDITTGMLNFSGTIKVVRDTKEAYQRYFPIIDYYYESDDPEEEFEVMTVSEALGEMEYHNKLINYEEEETLVVNNAWYIKEEPSQIIVEINNGDLKSFPVIPYRKITFDSLINYKGDHPRRIRGNPVPQFIYTFYGIKKNEETLSEVIRIRVSPSEKEKLEAIAKNDNESISEFVRNMIRSL